MAIHFWMLSFDFYQCKDNWSSTFTSKGGGGQTSLVIMFNNAPSGCEALLSGSIHMVRVLRMIQRSSLLFCIRAWDSSLWCVWITSCCPLFIFVTSWVSSPHVAKLYPDAYKYSQWTDRSMLHYRYLEYGEQKHNLTVFSSAHDSNPFMWCTSNWLYWA